MKTAYKVFLDKVVDTSHLHQHGNWTVISTLFKGEEALIVPNEREVLEKG